MRKSTAGRALLAAVAAFAIAGTASASITLGSVTPGTDPYSGPTPTYDFDPAGTALVSGGAVTTGTTAVGAQPYGSTGNYFTTGPAVGTPGTLDLSSFGDIYSLSFIWGSVDTYNTLEFLDSLDNVLATFVGNDIFNPANGNQSDPNTNPVVLFNLTGSDISAFTTLRFSSSQNAFEVDNFAINPVPEPGTWAMMLLGFGFIGAAMRSRRRRMTGLTAIA